MLGDGLARGRTGCWESRGSEAPAGCRESEEPAAPGTAVRGRSGYPGPAAVWGWAEPVSVRVEMVGRSRNPCPGLVWPQRFQSQQRLGWLTGVFSSRNSLIPAGTSASQTASVSQTTPASQTTSGSQTTSAVGELPPSLSGSYSLSRQPAHGWWKMGQMQSISRAGGKCRGLAWE